MFDDDVCPFTGQICNCGQGISASFYYEHKETLEVQIARADALGEVLAFAHSGDMFVIMTVPQEHVQAVRERFGVCGSQRHVCLVDVQIQILPNVAAVPRTRADWN